MIYFNIKLKMAGRQHKKNKTNDKFLLFSTIYHFIIVNKKTLLIFNVQINTATTVLQMEKYTN